MIFKMILILGLLSKTFASSWTTVLSQRSLDTYPCANGDLTCFWQSGTDTANFIDFRAVPSSGPYNFRLTWSDGVVLTWTQNAHPLDPANADTDASPTNVAISNNQQGLNFRGLTLSDVGYDTLLDGTPSSIWPGAWFYALGASTKWQVGKPGWVANHNTANVVNYADPDTAITLLEMEVLPSVQKTELFAASGNDASYSSRWTGWYTPGANRPAGATVGKTKAYDNLKLHSITFEVDDGTKIEVDLVGTQYDGMSLLEIVQSTGITSSSRNNGQGLWNSGHIALPITNKYNPNNHKMASTLRIVVGDGSNDGLDFCIFYFNDDNGRYDYHGYSAFGFGSETRFNPGHRGGICSIYGTPSSAPVDCPNHAWIYNFEEERCMPKSSNYGLTCRDDAFDLTLHHDIYGGDFSVGSCNFAYGGVTGLVTKTFLFADCTPNSYSDNSGKNHNEFVAEPTTGMHASLQIFPSINIHCIHQAFSTMTFTLFFEYDSEVLDDLLEYESGNIQNIVSIYSSSSDYMVGSTVHFHIKSVERVDNFVLELVSCTVSSPGNPHSADLFNAAIHPFLKTTVNGAAYASSMNMDSNIFIGDLYNVDYTGFKFVQEQDEFHHKVSCSLQVKSQQGALGTPPPSG